MKGLNHAIDDPELRSTVTSASAPTLTLAMINELYQKILSESPRQQEPVAEIAFRSVADLERFRKAFPQFTEEYVDEHGLTVTFHPFMSPSVAYLDRHGHCLAWFSF